MSDLFTDIQKYLRAESNKPPALPSLADTTIGRLDFLPWPWHRPRHLKYASYDQELDLFFSAFAQETATLRHRIACIRDIGGLVQINHEWAIPTDYVGRTDIQAGQHLAMSALKSKLDIETMVWDTIPLPTLALDQRPMWSAIFLKVEEL